jgi:hypothetical protein
LIINGVVCLIGEVRAGAEAVGLESPRDLQRVEVRGVDLIERRIAGDAKIAAPRAPLAVSRSLLGVETNAKRKRETYERLSRRSAKREGGRDHFANGSGRNCT